MSFYKFAENEFRIFQQGLSIILHCAIVNQSVFFYDEFKEILIRVLSIFNTRVK